jgi:D-3-phosphoglycerate dehydrogenase
MRILVVGDAYVPVDVFRRELDRLVGNHRIEYAQLDMSVSGVGDSESDRRIREYAGSPGQVIDRLDGHQVLVVHGAAVTEAVLDASPELRLVCCARGGPVNIDVEAASRRGIPVVTTPGKNAESVADLTIGFAVLLARGVVRAANYLAAGGRVGESAFEGAEWLGSDLGGHTLGLVGYGHVGRRVAPRARAFGMDVTVYDPYVDADEIRADGLDPVAFDDLLHRSQFVSLHARQTTENRDLFGREQFARMRRGAYFINTARETLVDEEALLAALESGHLAGAALDVIRPRSDGEPSPLLARIDVVVTPHIGGATHETLARGAHMLAEEIERFAAGEQLHTVINREALGE